MSVSPIISEKARSTGILDRAVPFAPFGSRLPRLTHQSRWLVWALAVAGACTVASALIAIFAPSLRPILLQEDGIIEMASAACLAVVVLAAVSASVAWGPRMPLVVGGLIGFVELMDETSFGARIFGFEPPALYGGGELDGFHDLLILAYRLLRDISPGLSWVWVGLILAASVGTLLLAVKQFGTETARTESWIANHALIFLHIGFVGLAQAIDVATASGALSAVEEVLEFNAALVLVFYIIQQAVVVRKECRLR